jgi:hypothetical protein
MDDTYYVIYSPKVCNYFLKADPNNSENEYLKKGYYMTALPLEAEGIRFKGTEFECWRVLKSLNMFVYN